MYILPRPDFHCVILCRPLVSAAGVSEHTSLADSHVSINHPISSNSLWLCSQVSRLLASVQGGLLCVREVWA